MKYLFIYPDVNTSFRPSVHHGLAQLSSILKVQGHDVSLAHVVKEPQKGDIADLLEREEPDIVGFTAMSNQIEYVKTWSRWVKEHADYPVICGGVHATLCPQELLNEPSIDLVCIGEGDKVITEVFDDVVSSELTPQPRVADLDTLPFPDYSIFNLEKVIHGGIYPVIMSRGCPHDCSYCCNHALRGNQAGQYFRFRSPDNAVAMLEDMAGKYPVKGFSFADDIFGSNRRWVEEFCKKYAAKIGLPFDCNLRVESVNRSMLELMRDSGCTMIEMGIESGNEQLRRDVLNRKMTNEHIVLAFQTAHALGVKTRAYNMLGIPGETPETCAETLRLNQEAAPDDVAVFYFYPFEGTQLYDVCREEGLLSDRRSTNYVEETVLDLPTITHKELKTGYDRLARYSIVRKLSALPMPLRWAARAVLLVLRLVTNGRDVETARRVYLKVSQWRAR